MDPSRSQIPQLPVVYRPTIGGRVLGVLFGAVWAGASVSVASAYKHGEADLAEVAFWTVFGVCAVVFGVLDLLIEVKATPDGLEVTNYFSRRRIAWSGVRCLQVSGDISPVTGVVQDAIVWSPGYLLRELSGG